MSTLTDLLSLGHVPRWTIVRHVRDQSVAEHSFNVAVIAYEIYERHRGQRDRDWSNVRLPNLLLWALHHDLEECVTGDIPSPAKKLFIRKLEKRPAESFSEVTLIEIQVVKLADTIDAYTWLRVHGLGAHAAAAEKHIHFKLYDQIKGYEWVDYTIADNLITEIVGEEGRLRT